MKYLLYLVWITYIIWWIAFIKFWLIEKYETKDLIKNENSIVIIIPEEKLISFQNNPRWIFEDNKNYWIWAGFIISNDWKIQTVNHIIENDNISYIAILNNKKYETEIISRNNISDLATIKILTSNNEIFSPLEIEYDNQKLNIWDTIFSYWVDIQNLKIISNTWTLLNKKSKLDKMSNLLEISNSLNPGFSGWPIINKDWKVIWINYAISEWKNYWISF